MLSGRKFTLLELLLTMAVISITSPTIDTGGFFTIVQGDAYLIADSRQIDFAVPSPPDLTGGSAKLWISKPGADLSFNCTIVSPGGAGQIVRLELTGAQSATIPSGISDYQLQMQKSNGTPISFNGRIQGLTRLA